MRRYQPLRLIVGKDSEPAPEDDFYVQFCKARGIEESRWPRLLIDVLECGHRVGAKILPRTDRNPYVHKGDEVYRKCPECPRVESA